MRFLHIIPPSRRMMETYMKNIAEHFDDSQHYYYFINQCPESEQSLFEFSNVIQMQGKNKYEKAKHLLKHLFEAEHVIWHGLTYSTKHMLLLYIFRPILKKSVWVMWGIDLYNWEREEKTIIDSIKNRINRLCREKMGTIVALLETDIEYYKNIFRKSKARCYTIPYAISKESFLEMDRLKKWKPRKNGKLFVQVAHNAHPFNNHLDILKSLSGIYNSSMELYIPLSYGNDWSNAEKNYIAQIVDYCAENYSGNVYCLRRLMPQIEYTKFLWNIDIAIFNAKRQNALGNILKLLYMGNKVFLTSDGPLYKFFREKEIEVFDTNDIKNMTYEEFVRMPNQSKAEKWIKEMYHPEFVWKKWAKLFTELDSQTIVKELQKKENFDIRDDATNNNLSDISKDNYINVSRYLSWGAKKNFSDVRDVIVVGDVGDASQIIQWIGDFNKRKLSYFVEGVLDEFNETANNILGLGDIIGKPSEWKVESEKNKYYVCAYKYPDKKEKYVFPIKKAGGQFISFIHPYTSINNTASIGTGTIIGPFSQISYQAKIGEFTYIENAIIEHSVEIGKNCFIGAGCRIGANSIIKDNTIIEKNTIIPPGTIMS